jgi:hypothetical protein
MYRMAKRNFLRQLSHRIKNKIEKTKAGLRKSMNRGNAAHLFMVLFVLLNSAGAWLIAPQYGLITAGVCSGIYGYLLGNE